MRKAVKALADFGGGYISADGIINTVLAAIPTDAATAVTDNMAIVHNKYQFAIELTKIIGGIIVPIAIRWIDGKMQNRRKRRASRNTEK